MKKFLLILSILLSVIYVSAHEDEDICPDKAKYMAVYDYIISDSVNVDKTIYVFDSIADLDIGWFREDINRILGENKTDKDYWKFSWKENRFSPLLASLFQNNKNPWSDKILIFSDIENNMLLAEVWNVQIAQPISEQTIGLTTYFGEYYLYLFIFNNKGELTNSFKRLLIAN